MTTATTLPARGTTSPADTRSRSLTPDECRSWLTRHAEGRLGYLSGRGPRNVVTAYAVSGGVIVIRIPDYNEMAQYVPGRRVTLDVTGRTDADAIGRVEVTGQASVCSSAPADGLSQLPDEGWPDDLSTVLVSVPLEELTGQILGPPACVDTRPRP